ncbi:MAG TPA: hypothetical protein VGP96_13235 [Candidatus Dormibacteraeota bacterium]|jgi:hypothetical protein|nr:hypothetical protein [Chloroflexota bacterium]HEV7467263.1 hypothetical protein [Candidatus Dormibacteraeota bacterium]
MADPAPPQTTLCVLCRVTVLPAGRRLCFRCWRMMRPEERRAIAESHGGKVPPWVDRGHD